MSTTPDPTHTTATGVFPNKQLASNAVVSLLNAGFRPDQVHVCDADTPTRHEFIEQRTNGTKRAVILGALFGATGGVLGGAALSGVFGFVPAIAVGGLAAAAGGALLGRLVGRSTRSQVQEELEHQVDAGTVLVSVTTDSAHGHVLVDLLAKEGGSSMVSTPGSFTAGIVPTTTD